ncbi:flagellar hook protein FlgE [Rhodopseudomonas rhenobacensis]|uniref:Flagellar hook protein FlgE n=1 Tax=Rhodopseudomonas rhenobacensis TaxID=87461 RepID=A0A7W7Z7A6_9BRAD|nr:flagellar hook protein FlgE [Rhodopseudomonas rhenobacensis]MBB5049140.1 flagellar hook protein FlgE [Rhodopseudomonas rhenobacensis]
MSLSGALSSAISALSAQSSAMAMISDNIANSSTVGYKTTSASFQSLVTSASSATTYSSGGVTTLSKSNISEQGLLTTTTSATDIGISGNGFFPVTTALTGGSTLYTRAGSFTIDDSGYLVSSGGAYLLGWRTDADGNVVGSADSNNLEPINTTVATTSGSASTETDFALNLPSDAATNATFTSSMSVYDSLGTASSIQVTWTKTGTNTWSAAFGNPTLSSDSTKSTGTRTGSATITFNEDGSLASQSATTITVDWTTGAAASTIALNFGTVGGTDGLTQKASGETTPTIDLTSIESNGLAYGKLSSIAVGDDGKVNATYSNGETIAIYKIPVATFTAPDELQAQSNGLYAATAASGTAVVQASGTNGAGTIEGGELEASTSDTNSEFSNMISAQQAYSAASQVITAVNKMYDTLMSAMR